MPLSQTLLDLLDTVDAATPLGRKRLLGPSVNYAREALVALIRRRGGVLVGWEGTTLRRLADELAFTALHQAGRRVATDIELVSITSAALDRVLERGCPAFAPLAESVGFRRAVHDAVLELRIAGVGPDQFDALPLLRPATQGLRDVLASYDALRVQARLADPADVFTLAIAAFEHEAPFAFGDARVVIAGLLEPAGLPARLLQLVRGGPHAVTEWTPPSLGTVPLANVQVVRAAAPEDEMLALCRSLAAERAPFDAMECVADDRDAYGAALHAVAVRLDADMTALHGLPMADVRLGRAMQLAVHALAGPRVDVEQLAAALERRELQAPAGDLPGAAPAAVGEQAALARFVRTHRIGGASDRLRALRISLARTESELAPERREDEADESYLERTERFRRLAGQAVLLLDQLIALRTATSAGSDRLAPSALAGGLLAWLGALVPALPDEHSARRRLGGRLETLAAVGAAPAPRAQAVAEVQGVLESMRVWPTPRRAPYSSAGGAMHLTDVRHAGATGRPRAWFAGLDAESVRGAVREAPLLDDAARATLRDAMQLPLPGTAERTRRRREALEHAVAAAVARGAQVTLSWAAGVDGDVAPDRLVLDALRARPGAAVKTTKELLHDVAQASAIPAGGAVLDDRDAWLQVLLADGPRDGSAALAGRYAGLARWLSAREALTDVTRISDEAVGHVPAAAALVPTQSGRSVSATELAELLACPRQWLLKRALRLHAPDAPPDPTAWLDALAYGQLVHRVYAQAVQMNLRFDAPDSEARLRVLALDAVDAAASREPPESPAARAAVEARLCADVTVFAQMERAAAVEGSVVRRAAEVWRTTPRDGGVPLDGGRRLRLHARLDRVDRHADGGVTVWDYKTGKAMTGAAPLHRLVQSAVGAVLAPEDGERVTASGYRFATERADGVVLEVPAADRARVFAAADQVLAVMEQGVFPPSPLEAGTTCGFCSMAGICRVSAESFKTVSPLVRWAAQHVETADAADPVRRVAAAVTGAGAAEGE